MQSIYADEGLGILSIAIIIMLDLSSYLVQFKIAIWNPHFYPC